MAEVINSQLNLKENPTLRDFQQYIAEMIRERGFEGESDTEVFMLMMEECGELAKAMRKLQHIKSDVKSKDHRVDHEAADVLIYLLNICNRLDIDLEQAFREKEEINKQRVWK